MVEGSGGGATLADNLDAWRVAQQLLTARGDEAEEHIGRFVEHCARNGLAEGVAFWRRVAAALAELRRTMPVGRSH